MKILAKRLLWTVSVAAACAAAAQAAAQSHASSKPVTAPGFTRTNLPPVSGKAFPYSIEVPTGWQIRHVKSHPGIWLAPAGAEPPNDPRLIYIRISSSPFPNAQAVAANLKASDAQDDSWSASLLEIRQLGTVQGVLVRMDTGKGADARSTLALKLPFKEKSVDFMASASRADFDRLHASFERILLSVRPAK